MTTNGEFLLILMEIAFLLNLADRVYVLPKWAKDTQERCADILITFKAKFSITKETLKEDDLLQPEGEKFLSLVGDRSRYNFFYYYEWIKKNTPSFIIFLIVLIIGEVHYSVFQWETNILFNILFVFCLVPFIFKFIDYLMDKWFLFGGLSKIERLATIIDKKTQDIEKLENNSNEDIKRT